MLKGIAESFSLKLWLPHFKRFKERYYPRRNEFSRGLSRDGVQSHTTSQVPMNWVPMTQFPNMIPLGPQSIQLQRPVSKTNLNRENQETQQQLERPPISYKQAFTNQRAPSKQQYFPSHFLPSYQVPAPCNNEQFFR